MIAGAQAAARQFPAANMMFRPCKLETVCIVNTTRLNCLAANTGYRLTTIAPCGVSTTFALTVFPHVMYAAPVQYLFQERRVINLTGGVNFKKLARIFIVMQ